MQPKTRYAKTSEGYVAFQVVGDAPLDVVFVPEWTTVMDAAGSQRAAILGHAEGGPVAMLFAATCPNRTSALVLADTFARFLRAPDYGCGLPTDRASTYLQNLEERWGTGGTVDFVAPSLAHDKLFREWRARCERLAVTPAAAAAAEAVIFEIDMRAILGTIRVPTLVLHRAGNRHIRACHGQYLAQHISGAKYFQIPGEDDLFHVGETETFLNQVQEFLTGVKHVPEEDRVLATVLFTDIVGATEHAARVGDREWRDLLDRHNAVIRSELSRFRGREVDTAGDGFFATFDGPARAIRCAMSIRDAVRQLGIEIRAGLHTGECQRMGNKVGGIAVHIGARVVATAAANEVMVSSTVKDLVAGSGIRFADRGSHALKGVPGKWRLFVVDEVT